MSNNNLGSGWLLVQVEDQLMQSCKALGGFLELVLARPDDEQIRLTRGKLYNLLEPIEQKLVEAHSKLKTARKARAEE